jgi:F-type H+-transporting ATPase subunit a
VPKAPWYLVPPLALIEFISFWTRPISLSVRLFANMLAGHTLLKVFASFVIALGGASALYFKALSIVPFALIVAITALELLVAALQAYVFAILTCIYLNEALHLHDHHLEGT